MGAQSHSRAVIVIRIWRHLHCVGRHDHHWLASHISRIQVTRDHLEGFKLKKEGHLMAKTNKSSTKFQNFALLGTHSLDRTIYHLATTLVDSSNKLRGVLAYAMHRVPWTKAQIRLTGPPQTSDALSVGWCSASRRCHTLCRPPDPKSDRALCNRLVFLFTTLHSRTRSHSFHFILPSNTSLRLMSLQPSH